MLGGMLAVIMAEQKLLLRLLLLLK